MGNSIQVNAFISTYRTELDKPAKAVLGLTAVCTVAFLIAMCMLLIHQTRNIPANAWQQGLVASSVVGLFLNMFALAASVDVVQAVKNPAATELTSQQTIIEMGEVSSILSMILGAGLCAVAGATWWGNTRNTFQSTFDKVFFQNKAVPAAFVLGLVVAVSNIYPIATWAHWHAKSTA